MSKERDIAEKLDLLNRKMEILTTVTAVSIFQGKSNTEKIALLLENGLTSQEIGNIIGIQPNSVRAIKSKITKKTGTEVKAKLKNNSGKKNGTTTI
jgi:DNA-binding NarL/FixJ family response regulator